MPRDSLHFLVRMRDAGIEKVIERESEAFHPPTALASNSRNSSSSAHLANRAYPVKFLARANTAGKTLMQGRHLDVEILIMVSWLSSELQARVAMTAVNMELLACTL